MTIHQLPHRGGDSNELASQPPPPNPPDMEELVKRVTQVESRMGALERSVDGLKSVMDGFKESLRAMQWSLGIILTVGLVAIGWMLNGMNGQITGMNARLDRFLERQAETASAANARFDRLLEQRSTQPPSPIVIQIPGPASPTAPKPPSPPSH